MSPILLPSKAIPVSLFQYHFLFIFCHFTLFFVRFDLTSCLHRLYMCNAPHVRRGICLMCCYVVQISFTVQCESFLIFCCVMQVAFFSFYIYQHTTFRYLIPFFYFWVVLTDYYSPPNEMLLIAKQ